MRNNFHRMNKIKGAPPPQSLKEHNLGEVDDHKLEAVRRCGKVILKLCMKAAFKVAGKIQLKEAEGP